MGWYIYSNLWEILFLGQHAWEQLSSLFIKTACTLKHLPSGKLSSWLTLTWELIQAAKVHGQGSTEQHVGIRLFHNTNWQRLLFWESCSAGIQALCLTTDFQGVCPFSFKQTHDAWKPRYNNAYIYTHTLNEKRTVPPKSFATVSELLIHVDARTF